MLYAFGVTLIISQQQKLKLQRDGGASNARGWPRVEPSAGEIFSFSRIREFVLKTQNTK